MTLYRICTEDGFLAPDDVVHPCEYINELDPPDEDSTPCKFETVSMVEDTGDLYRLNLDVPTVGTYDEVTERMKSLGVLVPVGEEPFDAADVVWDTVNVEHVTEIRFSETVGEEPK